MTNWEEKADIVKSTVHYPLYTFSETKKVMPSLFVFSLWMFKFFRVWWLLTDSSGNGDLINFYDGLSCHFVIWVMDFGRHCIHPRFVFLKRKVMTGQKAAPFCSQIREKPLSVVMGAAQLQSTGSVHRRFYSQCQDWVPRKASGIRFVELSEFVPEFICVAGSLQLDRSST